MYIAVGCFHATRVSNKRTRIFGISPIFGGPTAIPYKVRNIITVVHCKTIQIHVQNVISLNALQEETKCPILISHGTGQTILIIRISISNNSTITVINHRVIIHILIFNFTDHTFYFCICCILIIWISTHFCLVIIESIFYVTIQRSNGMSISHQENIIKSPHQVGNKMIGLQTTYFIFIKRNVSIQCPHETSCLHRNNIQTNFNSFIGYITKICFDLFESTHP